MKYFFSFVLILCIFCYAQVQGQGGTTSFNPTEVVKDYCQAWQSKDYQKMFNWLTAAQKSCGKSAFVAKYKQLESQGMQLTEFTVFPPVIVAKTRVKINVQMIFAKEVLPEIKSGIRVFYLNKEQDSYRIDKISAPVLPSVMDSAPGNDTMAQ